MRLPKHLYSLGIRTRLRNMQGRREAQKAEAEAAKAAAVIRNRYGDDLYVRSDFVLLLDKASVVDRYVIEKNDWEFDLREKLFGYADRYFGNNDQIFMDVGSYFGLYALHASRNPRFTSVHAFEADPLNFSQLQANLFLNRLTHRIEARNVFVDAKSGFVEMTKSTAMPDNRGGVGRYNEKDNQQTVRSAALDDILDFKDRRLVIKVDVENAELEALKGMRRLIGDNRIVMQIESGTRDTIISACKELGLRYLDSLHDHYFTTE